MALRRAILSRISSLIGERSYARIRKRLRARGQDAFLREITGVIHIGANTGQERDAYADFDLDVIWVEPISHVLQTLKSRIAAFPKQRAYKYLITGEDAREYNFHIATNNGEASSILPLYKHAEMWPSVS